MTVFVDMLLEGRKEYLSKYADQLNVKDVLDKFWALRHRVSAPKNDIDWWIKRPYSDLQQFVNDFDVRSRSIRRSDTHAQVAEKYGAKMLGMSGPYEVWYIPSHEAAQEIGRLYKGVSAKWCISTENPEYFYQSYNEYEFIFLVLVQGEPELPGFDKLAIEMSYNYSGKVTVHEIWDSEDDRAGDRPDYLENDNIIKLVDKAVDMFQQSGLSRKKYQNEQVEKVINNPEWIKDKLFENPNISADEDGSYTTEYGLEWLNDILEKNVCDGIDSESVQEILQYEYFNVFNAPDEPSFEYMHKTEDVFNKIMKPYGVEWDMLTKVYKGIVPDGMDDNVYQWLSEKLDEDFHEGNSYYVVWHDCWIEGTGNEARDDILGQLKNKAGVQSCRWSENDKKMLMTCRFSKNEIRNMAKLRLQGLTDDPLLLSLYNKDNEFEEISIDIPYYGWNGFAEDMMVEAAADFAKRLVGYITMQKDLPGQMYFDFDKPDNPKNLPRS